jgi:hypothetical protein
MMTKLAVVVMGAVTAASSLPASANPIDHAVDTLGIDKAYQPIGPPVTVSITPAMKAKPKPGMKLTFYTTDVTKKYGRNACVAFVVAGPKGAQIFAYIGARTTGKYEDQASDGGSGEPLGIQMCTVLNQDIVVVLMTDRPADLQYRAFVKTPAFTPAQVEQAIEGCVDQCNENHATCMDFHAKTAEQRAVCEQQARTCATGCRGD